VTETLVRQLVGEVQHSQATESTLRQLLSETYEALPAGKHTHLTSIPGYLWMAALSGLRSNPALRALYRRLKAKGKRGDVAMGHCTRKLLHLVYAVWKTGQPFAGKHYPWIQENDAPATETSAATTPDAERPSNQAPLSETPAVTTTCAPRAGNDKAVGHKRDRVPVKQVVTTAPSSVKPVPAPVNPPPSSAAARPKVDFVYLRQQVTMEQVLGHLGIWSFFKGTAEQWRGPCPIHTEAPATMPAKKYTCSVQLGKNIFQCFQAECAAHGNVLDLWAAVHRLPLYDAALHLAATFHLPRNREEEPVLAAQHPARKTGAKGTVITANGG
jgi:CHC2 zinc finger